jgi:hypothetical protein
MNTLSDIISNTREMTILASYNASVEDLKAQIEKNPFQTTFTIVSGCCSALMTQEIVRRYNDGGVKAIVKSDKSILVEYPL